MAWVLKMDDATIESGLVHDFDASLSGIGQELGAGAYSMRLETGSTCRHAQLQQHTLCLEVDITSHCYPLCIECGGFSLFWDLEQGSHCRVLRSGTQINFSIPTQKQKGQHVLHCERQMCYIGSPCCLDYWYVAKCGPKVCVHFQITQRKFAAKACFGPQKQIYGLAKDQCVCVCEQKALHYVKGDTSDYSIFNQKTSEKGQLTLRYKWHYVSVLTRAA